MNRDTQLIFEAYKQHLEEMAVKLSPEKRGEAGSTAVAFPPKSVGKYDITPELTKDVIEAVVSKLEEMGGSSDLSDKEFQAQVIAPIIKEIAKKSGTNSGYAARVIHAALKNAGVLTAEKDDVSIEDASPAAQDEAAQDVPEVAAATPQTPEETAAAPESGSADRTTTRIEHMLAELVDEGGVLETGVVKDVIQSVLDSGGLGIEESKIAGKVKAVMSDLIRKKVFERKGQYVKLGSNYEKFEAGGDQGSTVLSDEDLITKVTGHGERDLTGRSFWSRQE
jgi:hypothetical protein